MADNETKKKHPGSENLRVPTSEQARINGRKGGLASGEARRRRKDLKELAKDLLRAPAADKSQRELLQSLGLDDTNGSAMLYAMLTKSLSGSERAAEFVRDTSGQAPAMVQHIVTSDTVQADEVGQLSDDDLRRVISEADDT